jgi:hypothetical protein
MKPKTKTKTKTHKLVSDVRTHWLEMAGDSSLQKQLNAYLTDRFISPRDMPPDECLTEAKAIISKVLFGTPLEGIEDEKS